ncbi:MAG: ethanolamine ammonia-lyase subunit EutC [Propionibacteriaceae bacterium]|jgi:ethanolamine ammonia-lyase small subunit|nr:ethanolamine ammonia-lyase subunit EutC [Propionibacteriaceae bacterium]
MYQENEVKDMVRAALSELLAAQGAAAVSPSRPGQAAGRGSATAVEEGFVPDVTAVSTKDEFHVPDPANREGYLAMKRSTVGRIGVWRAGPRYNTWSMLHFRADHATAQDAVFTDVPDEFVASQGFVAGQSLCTSKDEFLTRPDLGRQLDEETKAKFARELPKGAKVTIMVADGLSSAAMVNIPDIVPAIKQGLKGYGIDVGPIPYVKYGRVGSMDEVGQITGSDVVCLLIGERPGLATGESMSAYLAYQPNPDRPESWRTVVSNIYAGGTAPAEAGAHVATIIKKILDERVSGVDLSL